MKLFMEFSENPEKSRNNNIIKYYEKIILTSIYVAIN